MTLEALYFIAQIMAALAIVGSLVFVGLQIRAQTKEQWLVRIQYRNESLSRFFEILNDRPENRDVFIEGLASFQSLSPPDRVLFDNLMTAIARTALIYERQLLNEDISKESFQQFLVHMTPFWGAPGCAEWLELRGKTAFGSAYAYVGPITGSPEGRRVYDEWRTGFLGLRDDA